MLKPYSSISKEEIQKWITSFNDYNMFNENTNNNHLMIFSKQGIRECFLTNMTAILDGSNDNHDEFIVFSDKYKKLLNEYLETIPNIIMLDSVQDVFGYYNEVKNHNTYRTIFILKESVIIIETEIY
jgi:hypothetical protein